MKKYSIFNCIADIFKELVGIRADNTITQKTPTDKEEPPKRSQEEKNTIELILAAMESLNANFEKYDLKYVPETEKTVSYHKFRYKTQNGIPFQISYAPVLHWRGGHNYRFWIDDVVCVTIYNTDQEFAKIRGSVESIREQEYKNSKTYKKKELALNKIRKFATK